MTTHPNIKKIFVLDDQDSQLKRYVKNIEECGFHVRGAKSLDEAEEILEAGESFDLLLLDMNLDEDPRAFESNICGSDVGEQFIQRQQSWPPEVLTMTVHYTNVDWWRRSFAIGAAALIEKLKVNHKATVNYVRVFLLRRAVGLNNPLCQEAIKEVLKGGGSEYQMLDDFFRRLILPEFDTCLDAPFVLVLEHDEAHAEEAARENFLSANESEAALKKEIVELVAKAAYYSQVNELKEPLLLDEAVFKLDALPPRDSFCQLFFSAQFDELQYAEKFVAEGRLPVESLEDAAFISLQLTPGTRLSLLLLKDKRVSDSSKDSLPVALARLLAKYTLDTLRLTLTNLIEIWRHEQQIKQVQLEDLASFCRYVGAETKRIVFEADSEGFTSETNRSLSRLNLLADELSEASVFLHDIGQEDTPASQRLVVQEVIREAWNSLGPSSISSSGALLFNGDCQSTVLASKDELLFLFSRLLHWLVSFYEEDSDARPRISIDCSLQGKEIELSFESDSIRLHKILRDNLFVPMTQRINYEQVLDSKGPKLFLALYLVKTILEKRYKGSLTDLSEELPDEIGHKLIIRMPVLNR